MSPAKPNKAAMTPKEFRALLKNRGISQLEAARRLEVQPSTIWRWISGRTPINKANALLIKKTFT